MKKMSNRTIRILLINCLLTFTGLSVYGNQMNIYDSLTMDTITCNSTLLKILSWNIGMLPVLDLFKEKDDRAEAIANALSLCDYDIIVFQEAFTAHARAVINHTLHDQYPYAYGPANGSKFSLKFNSGIWILSKVPLQKKKEIEFTTSAGIDYILTRNANVIQWISRRIAVLKLKWGRGNEYLSDHHGIEGVIVFRKGDYLSKVY